MTYVVTVWVLVVLVMIYFIPTINAFDRKHHQKNAILLVNLFLGWTFLGWVAALVWSAMAIPLEYRSQSLPPPLPIRRGVN